MYDEEYEENDDLNPDRVGIRMDVLASIIEEMTNNESLKKIFGEPVAEKLVVVADNNDLRIEARGDIDLSEEDSETFLDILDDVIERHSWTDEE